jgi:hypothetical protein
MKKDPQAELKQRQLLQATRVTQRQRKALNRLASGQLQASGI